jgi:O-antigen/teichoic acid export membrane protein
MIRSKINEFLNKGSIRTSNLKKNVFSTILIKGLSVITNLLIVPVSINYVNPSQYGIWLTLSSIVGWLSFFDIGFGNGFRNKFAIARANNDNLLAKTYVSTIYKYLSIIFITIWLIFIFINSYINWDKLLNVKKDSIEGIAATALIIFTYFCIQFVLKIINTILIADQKPAIASLIDTLSQIASLVIIFLLTVFTKGSLINLAIALTTAPVAILITANFWLYKNKYSCFRPSLKLAKFNIAKDILGLGGKFFIIQIAGIVQYQTANFIIARFFGSIEVTAYNIAFKYFSLLSMVFAIFLIPFWSAVTEAFEKKEIDWIKSAVNKYLKIWGLFFVLGLLMLFLSNFIYDLWIGKGKVLIPVGISFWSYIFVITSMFSGIFISVINGVGAIKIQYILSLFTPFIFIGFSIVFIKFFKGGVESIIISSIIANITGIIVAPVQYRKIVTNTRGIWIS